MKRRTLPRGLRHLLLACGLGAALSGFTVAQTGPFTDGELLVRVPDGIFGPYTLHRVDPSTGQAVGLMSDITGGQSKGGWMAYDPYRGAILAYCVNTTIHPTNGHLFQVQSDGSFASLGFVGAKLRALAPVGDGRVYGYSDTKLHLLDAANGLTPVLDENGFEIELAIDHLVYDPATNSLIGTGRTNVDCAGFNETPIYRLTLSGDGTSVTETLCSNYAFGATGWPIGLDHLPGGSVLLTMVGGFNSVKKRFLEIDPATLAVSVWAETDFTDLDGSVWVPALGGAVAFEDGDNELRLFPKGSSGTGILIPTSVVLGNVTSGVSSVNGMTDIDLLGPGCGGLAKAFGTGLAGTGGAVPNLSAGACPALGATLPLTVTNGLGGSLALLLLGLNTGAVPAYGGTLFALPPFPAIVNVPLGGAAGQGGAGFGSVNLPVPMTPALLGAAIFGQALVADGAAPFGIAFTRGLDLRIG